MCNDANVAQQHRDQDPTAMLPSVSLRRLAHYGRSASGRQMRKLDYLSLSNSTAKLSSCCRLERGSGEFGGTQALLSGAAGKPVVATLQR